MAVLTVVLDINVWVANFLAAARGRDGTSCQVLVETLINGQSRLGPVASRTSHLMLDTLEAVLVHECGFPPLLANAARNVAEQAGAAAEGIVAPPAIAVVGGGVQPMLDMEDIGVLETALAANADLIVTSNIADFTRGPRSRLDASVARAKGGKADVIIVSHPRLPRGITVATPFAARAWLAEGAPPPAGVLSRFVTATQPPR
jgi:predicted nucleic acid-binding protein